MRFLSYIHHPNIDPVMFHLGPIAVRWYGFSYLLAFFLCYVWLRWMIKRNMLRMSVDALNDVMSWLVLGIILGARLGWWLFYHRSGAQPEAWYAPLAIWEGGMSFHGGLLGVLTVLVIWTWRHHVSFWNLIDCSALVVPVGLFLGRIANFINAELVGRPTTVPWGVIFPGQNVPRHPSQIYEAILEGPVLLALLWAARRWINPREGRIGALFVIGYGIIRFSVEFTREPDVQLGFIAFGWLTMGQLLSTFIALGGVALWVWLGWRKPAEMQDPASKERA